ncbi:MAG TPA: helix-turn-helix domain-containing protein [Actinopolymorphaceae bacterium]|nr:helix-turn-helix domain-containing protein [Actinopolymorphaceae bacterium]
MSDVLGLDRHMHEAYQLLLRHCAHTATGISHRLGISRTQADETLARLAAAGLVEHAPDDPRRLLPVDPRRGLAPLIARRQAQLTAQQQVLSRSREAVAALTAEFATAQGAGPPPPTQSAGSDPAIRTRIEDMVAASRTAVMCFVADGASSIALDVSSSAVESAIDRGVSVKAVYSRTTLDAEEVRAHARWLVSLGGSARAATTLPPAMLVVDRATALIPADVRSSGVSVVRNRTLAAALASLFDHVWGGAQVAAPAPMREPSGEPSPQERDLLRLLGTGLTDASAARQLGVSLRTVRRMMAELMARLHARSRFEAGIRAAERGWIRPNPVLPVRRTLDRRHPSPSGRAAAING